MIHQAAHECGMRTQGRRRMRAAGRKNGPAGMPWHRRFGMEVDEADMEKIVEQGLLYDFYGELLTPHQQRIYEDAVFNDLSLSEIAQEAGISRQGVHDLIKRCDRTLEEYENRLHLMRRFGQIRQKLERIRELCDDKEVRRLTEEILQEL